MNCSSEKIAKTRLAYYNKDMKKMSLPILKKLKNCPLWVQTASLFSLIITIAIVILIMNNYLYNRKQVIDTHVKNAQTILSLEMDNVSSYVKELTSFAIQPVFDHRFSRIIESGAVLTEDDIDYVKEQMKAYYYTRSDLNSYQIYILKHNLIIGRERNEQHFFSKSLRLVPETETPILERCAASDAFLTIEPSNNPSDFFTFYHSIIDVSNRSSIAYVRCDIDKDFLNTLLKSYSFHEKEVLLLYSSAGQMLYSGDSSVFSDTSLPLSLAELATNNSFEKTISGRKYLVTVSHDEHTGLSLVSLQPYSVVTSSVSALFHACLLQGVLLWFVVTILIYLSTRFLMAPLNDLAKHMKRVGEGDFKTQVAISGSSEITHLGDAFNSMSQHIETLINENYLVQLNEQAARLIALEAQMNPHFLYNTLQAISTEALVNDQPQIYDMVVALSVILRYSIKAGDFVTLAEESEHVNKYIYLQKIRMGDNLQYTTDLSEDSYTCLIPKISLQTLVENSIVHGIGGNRSAINISLSSYIEKESDMVGHEVLHIIATDNGCGMDEETLSSLKKTLLEASFEVSAGADRKKGLGLKNLYDRFDILYGGMGKMEIESTEDVGTTIHITLPVRRGV